MSKAFFTLALLTSALTLTLTARADPLDQVTFNFPFDSQFSAPIDFSIIVPASPAPAPVPFGFGLCSTACFPIVIANSPGVATVYDFGDGANQTSIRYASYLSGPNLGPPGQPQAYTEIIAPNLFSGPVTGPTFLTGTFDATILTFPGGPVFPGTITIEPVATSTPEPSTLALLTTGTFGLIAFAARRKTAHHFFN
jgi:PEP-CTERM motif